jgi:phage head maturation protease
MEDNLMQEVTLRIDHGPKSKAIATTADGSLTLHPEIDGLYFSVDGAGGQKLRDRVERGEFSGVSIGFNPNLCEGDSIATRSRALLQIREAAHALFEVTLVRAASNRRPRLPGTWVASCYTPGVLSRLPKGHQLATRQQSCQMSHAESLAMLDRMLAKRSTRK